MRVPIVAALLILSPLVIAKPIPIQNPSISERDYAKDAAEKRDLNIIGGVAGCYGGDKAAHAIHEKVDGDEGGLGTAIAGCLTGGEAGRVGEQYIKDHKSSKDDIDGNAKLSQSAGADAVTDGESTSTPKGNSLKNNGDDQNDEKSTYNDTHQDKSEYGSGGDADLQTQPGQSNKHTHKDDNSEEEGSEGGSTSTSTTSAAVVHSQTTSD